jgi:hypothetical protein
MSRRKLFAVGAITVVLGGLLAEIFTGYKDQPFGSGVITRTWVSLVPFPSGKITEVDRHSIESSVLDSDNWVFVVQYYVPGDPDNVKQTQILERLSGHFGSSVTFLKLDVSKHQDLPLCSMIKRSSVVAYALSRANSDRHKMTGFSAFGEPRGWSYGSLLNRIHACLWRAKTQQEHPQEWSINGWTTTDDSLMALRSVPFWSWFQPEHAYEALLEQQEDATPFCPCR